jgi:hypothetical protein
VRTRDPVHHHRLRVALQLNGIGRLDVRAMVDETMNGVRDEDLARFGGVRDT